MYIFNNNFISGTLVTLVSIWKYYDRGWGKHPPVKDAEAGKYTHIYLGEIMSKDSNGKDKKMTVRGRAAALKKLLWFPSYIKEQTLARG